MGEGSGEKRLRVVQGEAGGNREKRPRRRRVEGSDNDHEGAGHYGLPSYAN